MKFIFDVIKLGFNCSYNSLIRFFRDFLKAFKKFLKEQNISVGGSALTQNNQLIDILEKLNTKELVVLMKNIGLIATKRGNFKGSENGKSIQGTWIHQDLAVKYVEWLISKDEKSKAEYNFLCKDFS